MAKQFSSVLIFVMGLALLFSPVTRAEDFDLFNADRGKPPAPVETPPAPPPVVPPAPPPKTAPPVQKDFILRGTQIIGDRRSVTLETPTGKRLQQSLHNHDATTLKGFPGYVLHSIDPREIRLSYPADAPCLENRPEKGVQCESETLAVLTLQRGKPAPPKAQAPVSIPQAVPPPVQVMPGAPVAIPPPGQQFQPRIIKDEEIPPGMKRIRTPFGDRLVPER
jgi:hypothetical protein